MTLEYVIFADESIRRGKKYSNFFGGALVRSCDLGYVTKNLNDAKNDVNLLKEIKWSKITTQYLEKYVHIIDTLFDLIASDKIKIRIMFTDNRNVPSGLTREHREHEYFILYYQFIKHAFGLKYSIRNESPIRCRLYLDALPDTREKTAKFKGYLEGLTKYFRNKIIIDREQIAEVKSHDHVVLQCLDIVLGAIQFRLNEKHFEKPSGEFRRGKRTVAKEKIYKHILRRICDIRPHFNIGISTGKDNEIDNLWHHPYRHWLFIPNEKEIVKRPDKR